MLLDEEGFLVCSWFLLTPGIKRILNNLRYDSFQVLGFVRAQQINSMTSITTIPNGASANAFIATAFERRSCIALGMIQITICALDRYRKEAWTKKGLRYRHPYQCCNIQWLALSILHVSEKHPFLPHS